MSTYETHSATVARGGLDFEQPLVMKLCLGEDGPELASRSLRAGDLVDLRSEIYLELFARRGMPEVDPQDIWLRVVPRWSPTPRPRCEGFTVEAGGPGGKRLTCDHSIYLFGDIATLLAEDLVIQGQLGATDIYYWHIEADAAPPRETAPAMAFSIAASHTPLIYATYPIDELTRDAEVSGQIDPRHLPVFYLRRARQRAEMFARRGAGQQPPVETGAILIGILASCPDSGEFYAVVCDALELANPVESKFSLTFSGETWARAQAVIRARQAQQPAQRLLGQCHGHNFIPGDAAPPCEACATAKVCGRSSVFASTSDANWTRRALSGQAYALCHIFGLNARKEEVGDLFTFRDNQLQPRGYYVIDQFEPVMPA
jgi:hypothetical protein